MVKKGILGLLGLIVAVAVWYFLIYPDDYIVRFKANTTVGTLNQSIKAWQLTQEDMEIAPQKDISDITQKKKYGDSTITLSWRLRQLTDSSSQVVLGVSDPARSFKNKLAALQGNSAIQQIAEHTAKDFITGLQDHLDDFKITIDGESVTTPTYALYMTINSTQSGKAGGMMKHFSYLNSLIGSNGITSAGTPFLEVVHWDQEKDSLTFNFCFPIKNAPNLPQYKGVKYKRFFEQKALKATYNGNYISSDRAWYRLLAYAKEKGIAVKALPIEVFYNNPSYGGNDKDWKAEIFIPIEE